MSRTIQEINPSNALLWLNFRGQYDDNGKRVIRNYGKYPGAPRTVQCGDGVTANTYPTQLVGKRGLSFDATDYINTLIPTPENNKGFTVYGLCAGTTSQIISSLDSANSFRGISCEADTNVLYCRVFSVITTNGIQVTCPVTTAPGIIVGAGFTYDGSLAGSGVLPYVNGVLKTPTIGQNNLTGTIVGKNLLLGARWNGTTAFNFYAHNRSATIFFPFALTPTQVSILHYRLMRESSMP